MIFTILAILILIALVGHFYKRKLCRISDVLSDLFGLEVEIKIVYIDILMHIDYIIILIINAIYFAYNIELGVVLPCYFNFVIILLILQVLVLDYKFMRKRNLKKLKDTIL